MVYFDTSSLIIAIINSLFAGLLFSCYVIYKERQNNMGSLLCFKYLLKFGFYSANFCFFIYNSSKIEEEKSNNIKDMKSWILILYIILELMTVFFSNYELYKYINDPTLPFRSLIKSDTSYFKYILIGLIISSIVSLSSFIIKSNEYIYNLSLNYIFFLSAFIIVVCSIITLIYLRNKIPGYKFSVSSSKSFLKLLVSKLLESTFPFVYIIPLIFIRISDQSNKDYNESLSKFLLFLSDLLGLTTDMFCLGVSNFYYYCIGGTFFGCFFYPFGCQKSSADINEDNLSLLYEVQYIRSKGKKLSRKTKNSYSNYSVSSTQKEKLFLEKFFKQVDYSIENYFLENFEYFLNVTLDTLVKVYEQKLVNGTKIYDKEDLIKTKEILENTENKALSSFFNFNYKKLSFLQVNIETMFANEVFSIMNSFNISKNQILKSLNSQNGRSLLKKNLLEKMNLKNNTNFSLRTFDSKFILEFYDEDKIDVKLIKSYLMHLLTNTINTFFPILVGIFKIKINQNKNIQLLIFKNPFSDECDDQSYCFWQLLRFSKGKVFEKCNSSKENDSFNVTTELAFETNQFFKVNYFNVIHTILKNDIYFFRKINMQNPSLLILYYEYMSGTNFNKNADNNQNDKNDSLNSYQDFSAIDNEFFSKNEDAFSFFNKNNESLLPNSNENQIKESNLSINEESYSFNKNEIKPFFSSENTSINKNDISGIGFEEGFNECTKKNGFECKYNDFNGRVFLSFENIFAKSSSWCSSKEYYDGYLNELDECFNPNIDNIILN